MKIEDLEIPEIKILIPRRIEDERGYFSETFNARVLRDAGIGILDFIQDNHSYSRRRGTVRGLHFQKPPAAQAKLIRVVRGSILDVAVDIRTGSATFGRHVSAVLSADNGKQILIPEGFAHAFCTLQDDTEVAYKVSDHHAPDCDAGILWNDPDLGIDWPVDPGLAILSEKDRALPRLSDLPPTFVHSSKGR